MTVQDKHRIASLDPVKSAIAAIEDELAGRGRVLLRPSGTEPVVRVMVEGEAEAQVKDCAARLAMIVEEFGNK